MIETVFYFLGVISGLIGGFVSGYLYERHSLGFILFTVITFFGGYIFGEIQESKFERKRQKTMEENANRYWKEEIELWREIYSQLANGAVPSINEKAQALYDEELRRRFG